MSRIKHVKSIFDKMFNKYLIVTNVALGGGFMAVGDTIQQTLERKLVREKPHDTTRSGRMILGGMCFGALGHGWYTFLDRKFPGTTRTAISKKLLCEAALGPPLVLGFFVTVGFIERHPIKKSFKQFTDNILNICAMDWGFYVPMQYLNFQFLPPHYRFLYVSAITVVYDVFLSYILNKDKLHVLEEKDSGTSPENKKSHI